MFCRSYIEKRYTYDVVLNYTAPILSGNTPKLDYSLSMTPKTRAANTKILITNEVILTSPRIKEAVLIEEDKEEKSVSDRLPHITGWIVEGNAFDLLGKACTVAFGAEGRQVGLARCTVFPT
jgi:hypothetical protein